MSIFNRIDEVPYWAQEKIAGDQDKIAHITDEYITLKSQISELEKEIEKEIEKSKEESIFNFPAGTKVLINNAPKKRKEKMNRYICLDTETGGLTPDTSLLTAYFVVLDENLNPVDELYLQLKPENGQYVVTAQALDINKINLIEHDKVAITYKAAKTTLYQFLETNCFACGFKDKKLTPVGHGVYFDLLRVKQDLISQGSWESFVSYRTLDTSIVCQYLRAAGLFPEDVSGSLGSLVKYFGLPPQGELHNAKTDALQTVAVLKELLKIIKPITEIRVIPVEQ